MSTPLTNKFKITLTSTEKVEAKMLLVGVGQGGISIIEAVQASLGSEVDYFAVDTDSVSLTKSSIAEQKLIGYDLCYGVGTSGDILVGYESFQGENEFFKHRFEKYDLVFVVAGLGGGTGSTVAPAISALAQSEGPLVVGLVALPFKSQGLRQYNQSFSALEELKRQCDTVLVLENDDYVVPWSQQAFSTTLIEGINDEFVHIVENFHHLNKVRRDVKVEELIRVDFNDIRTILSNSDQSSIGFGKTLVIDRGGEEIAQNLLGSILRGKKPLNKIKGLVISFRAGPAFTLDQMHDTMTYIKSCYTDNPNVEVIFGLTVDTSCGDQVEVMLIATKNSSSLEGSNKEGLLVEGKLYSSVDMIPTYLRPESQLVEINDTESYRVVDRYEPQPSSLVTTITTNSSE